MANPIVGTLTTEIVETVGVVQSATVLINGFGAKLDAAVAAAVANGATEAELAPLTDLSAALDSETNALAAAVAANSPAPTPPSARK